MKEIGLTGKHIRKMRHMVGLDRSQPRRGKYEMWRNGSIEPFDNPPQELLDMVEWGLADYREEIDTSSKKFFLTGAGLDLLGEMIGAKITERKG